MDPYLPDTYTQRVLAVLPAEIGTVAGVVIAAIIAAGALGFLLSWRRKI